MARTPNGMNTIIQVDPLTPEQFVFWAKGYVEGRGEDQLQNDPATALGTIIEALHAVYIPQPTRGGCGCGGKG